MAPAAELLSGLLFGSVPARMKNQGSDAAANIIYVVPARQHSKDVAHNDDQIMCIVVRFRLSSCFVYEFRQTLDVRD